LRTRDGMTEYAFTSTIGMATDDRRILKEFNPLVAAAKLSHQRFLDLRYAYISLLRAQGVADKLIPEIVGHWDASLRRRTSAFTGRQAGSCQLMDGILDQITDTPEIPVATNIATKPVNARL
jgi:hypothetical protein